jgi:hypothetical protein
MKPYAILVLLAMVCLLGCGKKRPEGLEETYPCYVSVTKAGAPLADARIVLHSKTAMNFNFAGMTDSTGKAEIISEFDFKGAPAGTYAVAIVKSPENPVPKKTQAELSAMTMEESQAYYAEYHAAAAKLEKVIPDHLMVPSASPLEIVVTEAGPNEFSFEIEEHKTPPKDWKPPKH